MQTKFNDENMGGFWDGILFWFHIQKVKRQKKTALWEANIDKYYFETRMSEFLKYDDTEDRKKLKEQSLKAEEDKDIVLIKEIEERIANSKAIKQAYRKNEDFREDIKTFIDMLENFNAETKT